MFVLFKSFQEDGAKANFQIFTSECFMVNYSSALQGAHKALYGLGNDRLRNLSDGLHIFIAEFTL